MPERRRNLPTIHNGDCIEVLATLPDASVDAIVTDPPYGLSNTGPSSVADTITKWASGDRNHVPTGRGFMGKSWDAFVPPPAVWDECMRVLKPGGHMVVFPGSRTQDLMGLSIRLAGFEMRDSLAWLYGSGFPKSMNVGKAIDATVLTGKSGSRSIREATDSREVIGKKMGLPGKSAGQKPGTYFSEAMEAEDGKDLDIRAERLGGSIAEGGHRRDLDITAPATPEAAQWDGWGTALKPAFEPIVLARKPLAEKTVARNVLAHGTGAINVDACRIETEDNLNGGSGHGMLRLGGCHTLDELKALAVAGEKTPNGETATLVLARAETVKERVGEYVQPSGRWPANVLLDQHAAAWVDEQSGVLKSGALKPYQQANREHYSGAFPEVREVNTPANEGGASRFFYTAKAPKSERPNVDGVQHPTVKPLAIMRWLIRLVTPPGGVVLDPFAGSAPTIEAALIEGFDPVGIEMEADYLPLIQHRIDRQAGTLTA